MGSTKDGHPVPLSYLADDLNSGTPHPAHVNVPVRFSVLSGELNGRSVASCLSTSYAYGSSLSFALHSSSDIFTLPTRFMIAIAASPANSLAFALLDTTSAVVAAARLMSLRRGICAGRRSRSSSLPSSSDDPARHSWRAAAVLRAVLFAPGAAIGATFTGATRPMQCMMAVRDGRCGPGVVGARPSAERRG